MRIVRPRSRLRRFTLALTVGGLGFSGLAAAQTTVFTVGPRGADHTNLQDAMISALAVGGDREIRMAIGTYAQTLDLYGLERAAGRALSGSLLIEGGWDATFLTRLQDPSRTRLIPYDRGIFFASCEQGTLSFRNLSFEESTDTTVGLSLAKTCRVAFDRVHFAHNHVQPLDFDGVAGIQAYVVDEAILQVSNSEIFDNVVESYAEAVTGFWLQQHGGFIDLEGNEVRDNLVIEGATPNDLAALLTLKGRTHSRIVDNQFINNESRTLEGRDHGEARFVWVDVFDGVFTDNLISENRGASGGFGEALLLSINSPASPTTNVQRNRIIANETNLQVTLAVDDYLRFGDSIVAGGTGKGLSVALPREGASIDLVHLTVASNVEDAVEVRGPQSTTVTLSNSIAFDNGRNQPTMTPLQLGTYAGQVPMLIERRNMTGAPNPNFINTQGFDFRLKPGSPAIDAGVFSAPGGVSAFDVDGLDRVAGLKPDQGAHEFRGGCSVLDAPPILDETPACRCFETGLAEFRCTFPLPQLVVEVDLATLPEEQEMVSRWRLAPEHDLGPAALGLNQLTEGGELTLGPVEFEPPQLLEHQVSKGLAFLEDVDGAAVVSGHLRYRTAEGEDLELRLLVEAPPARHN